MTLTLKHFLIAAGVFLSATTPALVDKDVLAHGGQTKEQGSTEQGMMGQGMMKQGTMGQGMMGPGMMGPGLMMPMMDPARGRKAFAEKGCVVCHSVNGIGGEDAPPLDASTMDSLMNPFEFAAKMWRGAEAMIFLQREELGEQIELTGQDLADIIAFSHHIEEQRKFSESDIPPRIRELIEHGHENDEPSHHMDQ